MNQIGSKIYYEVSTGNILVKVSEKQGCVKETTKEEDMKVYEQLKDKNIDEIDFIQLEYGEFSLAFDNAKSYKVNLESRNLEVIKYTQEELDSMQKQNQEAQNLNTRISDISEYLNQDKSTITDIEDYILQKEQNKILGVV